VFQQTGSEITLTITVVGDPFPGTIGPGSGTIDPETGVFSVDLPDTVPAPPALPCPDNRIDGVAAADGLSITGALVIYSFSFRGCLDAGGDFAGSRCGPGVPGCCVSGEPCCGNGIVEGSEVCDPGAAGDACCSPSCQPSPAGTPCSIACRLDATCVDGACVPGSVAPAGTPCDDGDHCTGDRCDALGGCVDGDLAADCAPCERCNPAGGCVLEPRASCSGSSKSRLTLVSASATKKKLDWRVTSLPDSATGIFGNPVLDTEYAICVFEPRGLVTRATARPSHTCGTRPCWQSRRSGGFRFNDPSGQANGLVRIDLTHKNQIPRLRVRGKGSHLVLPAPGGLSLVLTPLVVQLQAQGLAGEACWEDRYDFASTEITPTTLKARRR
jgi:hypothetical protein